MDLFPIINRAAVQVKLKKKFLDWLHSIEDKGNKEITLQEINSEPHLYLIPASEDLTWQENYIEGLKPYILRSELSGWYTDPSYWPDFESEKIDPDDWLELTFSSMLMDTNEDESLIHE